MNKNDLGGGGLLHKACGMLVSWPGPRIEPVPLVVEAQNWHRIGMEEKYIIFEVLVEHQKKNCKNSYY